MRTREFGAPAAAAILLAFSVGGIAETGLPSWTFTPIDVPGATRTSARGMNQAGQIVGDYTLAGVTRGYILTDGVFTPIQLDVVTTARGINPEGDIVGTVRNPAAGTRGYLLSKGALTEIAFPGATMTVPDDINAAGDIIGWCLLGGQERGFLLRNGAYTIVHVPGASYTDVRGINAEGEMVGIYQAVDPDGKGRSHGFLLGSDGIFVTINGPDAPGGNASGINTRGEIVGEYSTSARFGFLLSHGEYTSFSYPGAKITRPWKITADGQHIVGFYDDLHGFVLSRKEK